MYCICADCKFCYKQGFGVGAKNRSPNERVFVGARAGVECKFHLVQELSRMIFLARLQAALTFVEILLFCRDAHIFWLLLSLPR